MFLLISAFVSVTILLCVSSLYYRFCYEGRLIAKLPGPKGVPIFGNAFDVWLDPEKLFKFLRKMNNDYRGLSKLTFFKYRVISITNPEDLEIVLSQSKFNERRQPYVFMRPWLGNGLLLSNGDFWHQRRKLLTPAFHFNILNKFLVIFNEHTEDFCRKIEERVGEEMTEIEPLLVKLTLNVLCETAMGKNMRKDNGSVSKKYFNAVVTLGDCVIQRFMSVWLFSDITFNMSKVAKIQNLALNDIRRFTQLIIKERKEFRQNNPIDPLEVDDDIFGRKPRLAMLDLLLDQEQQGKIDEKGITEEVDTFMFGGHHTIFSAFSFLLMAIANEPVVQNTLYEEMKQIFGDSERLPTVGDLNEMKYLDCCIKETLRLYPTVPFLARYNTQEAIIGGYKIPKDTLYFAHIYDLHRLESIYPDPLKFIPERFLPQNCLKRHPYAYIPFSAGPRNCIGQKFAMMEMKTVMSSLIRRFHLHPVTKPEDLTLVCDLVLRAKEPIYVRFSKRVPVDT